MTVVSCLQVTWPIIKQRAGEAAPHRFEELPVLETVCDAEETATSNDPELLLNRAAVLFGTGVPLKVIPST